MNFYIIYIVGAVQGLFLSVLLFKKRSNHSANRILAVLVLLYSLYLVEPAIMRFVSNKVAAWYFTIVINIEFLFGPMHYQYTRLLTKKEKRYALKEILHYLPMFLSKSYLYAVFFKTGLSLYEFIPICDQFYPGSVMSAMSTLLVIQGLIYMILTLRLLRRYARDIRDRYSSLEHINLRWLRNITWASTGVWLTALVVHILDLSGFELFVHQGSYPVLIALTIFIYAMGYFGFQQSEIFGKGFSLNEREMKTQKYAKTRLDESTAENYYQQIEAYMRNQTPYTKPDLSLTEMSRELNIPEHHVSQVINNRIGMNFFQYVNQYRIEDVKKKLINREYSHLSILGIALDAGFNSKSAFNTVFKASTHMTPSQYRKIRQ